jgi:hypothetical protein
MNWEVRMYRYSLAYIPLVAIALWPGAAASQRPDVRRLVLGRWSVNVAKSTYPPGEAPKSLTRTYVAVGDGLMYTDSAVTADGQTVVSSWTGSYDGREYPFSYDSLTTQAIKASDARHATFTHRRAGKVVGTGTRVISRDGRTMTVRNGGTVVVYEKQK